jgi:hypothetical protein
VQLGREINECLDELVTETPVPEQRAKTRFIKVHALRNQLPHVFN